MQGDATVLLVTVGEPPEGLQTELERLHVQVLVCGFAEAEGCLDEKNPDLVVLAGSRGAMELAMLLEDHDTESRPKMVIVAARKDLAKLRGLNREIVISLFALETTEKVVAQRVESLARRAARRRRPKAADEPALKKTSLGLPTAALAKVKLKSQLQNPAAPPPALSSLSQKEQQRLSSHPAPPEPIVDAPVPDEAQRAPRKASGRAEEKASGLLSSLGSKGDASTEAKLAESPADSALSKDEKTPKGPPLAPRRGPPSPTAEAPLRQNPTASVVESSEKSGESEKTSKDVESLMPDEDLVSLRPSEFDDEGEDTKVVNVPQHPGVPRFDSSGVSSNPPSLPPGAQASVPPVSMDPAEPGELDISAAEAALDNLDSVKLALTEEVREAARKHLEEGEEENPPSSQRVDVSAAAAAVAGSELGDDITERKTPHVPLDAVAEPPRAESAGERSAGDADAAPGDAIFEEETRANVLDGAKEPFVPGPAEASSPGDWDDKFESGPSTEALGTTPGAEEPVVQPDFAATEPLGRQAPSLSEGATGPGTRNDEPQTAESTVSSRSGDAEENRSPSLTAGLASQKRGGRSFVIGLAAALILGLLGAAVAGVFEGAPHTDAVAEADAVPQAKTQGSSSENPTDPSAQRAAEVPGGGDGDTTPPNAPPASEQQEPAEQQDEAKPGDEGEGTENDLDNPFVMRDSGAPSCSTLLGENTPTPGGDPIHEASLVWNEARKLIVAGKVKKAHQKMCEAVALNPESAAAEGLATLYIHLGSPKQALSWLERAEKMRPGQSELVNVRGDIYGLLGRTDEARKLWLERLGVLPDQTQSIQAISKDYSVDAGRHLRRGDLVRADLWYRRAVILDPQNLAGVMGLAKTFYRADKKDHARAFALRALEVSDVIPEVHVLLGEIALDEGDKEEAKRRFERALEVRPGFFPAKRGLSQVSPQ